MYDFTIFGEFNIKVQINHYRPSHSAPYCTNPSSRSYADSGGDEELEYTLFFVKGDKEIPVPEELYSLIDIEEIRENITMH